MSPVMMLDYTCEFSPRIMNRLKQCGVETIWVFDFIHQPACNQYDFSAIELYQKNVEEAGLSLVVQSPINAMPWMPDDWFMRNKVGETSAFRHEFPNNPFRQMVTMGQRVTSYWCEEAENNYKNYVLHLKKVIKRVVPAIGASCGECIFPSSHFYPFLSEKPGPWWFDHYAKESWRKSGLERIPWFHKERKKIIARRLSWYDEIWTVFGPYFKNYVLGNDRIWEDIPDNIPTILFTVFTNQHWLEIAKVQAKRTPTWSGAEGAKNVYHNTIKALQLGFQGTICGPLFPAYEQRFEDWMYKEIARAVQAAEIIKAKEILLL